ncbi:MAG TPA: hypothetical protein VH591_15805 [Ktedonobacterales bacterium]|jgi:hypothetical protein
MRTIRRTVILLGCIGFVILFALQYVIALAATPLIAVVGIIAGLAIAKWLPWAWYGRQFAAGVRGGLVACGLAAAGMFLSSVATGTRSVETLAERSHLSGIGLAQLVNGFGELAWFMPYLALTAFFTVGGILLAGVVSQIFGWSKNVRTVRVIREAHNSASLLHRSQTWAPASNNVPSGGGYWNSILPSASPASNPGLLATGTTGASRRRPQPHPHPHMPVAAGPSSRARAWQDEPFDQEPSYLAPLPPQDSDAPEPIVPLSTPESIPPRRSNSGAYPVQFAMTDDLRDALDRWDSNPENPEAEQPEADDLDADKSESEHAEPEPDEVVAASSKTTATKKTPTSRAKTPSKRTPKASAYLNSEPSPAPRRSRKKQDTRDWLC